LNQKEILKRRDSAPILGYGMKSLNISISLNISHYGLH
jgi:hypothetical protein